MSTGQLSKTIPARRKVIKFDWVRLDFTQMSDDFRLARKGMKPLDTCFWCRYKFQDGDQMAVAAQDRGPNVVLCQPCAKQSLLKESEDEG